MIEEDDLYKEDELVILKLPRSQYKILKIIIEREETYSRFTNGLKNNWIWVVGGGLLTFWALWDQIHSIITGIK